MVDFMKIEKIEKYLEEVSEGTDFSFRIADVHDREIELYMQGDNPCNEDWCIDITIKNPKTQNGQKKIEREEEKSIRDLDTERNTKIRLLIVSYQACIAILQEIYDNMAQ